MTDISLTRKEEKEMLMKALFGSPFFNILASVLATFIVGAVFFKYGGGVPINVTSTTTEKTSTFDVSGEGSVTVAPDEARVRLGVSEEGASIAAIQERVNRVMEELAESLKDLGVDTKDIKTSNYSVNQNYQTKGYTARAEVVIKVRELAETSEVLDLVGKLGLEQVGGLTFGLSEQLEKESLKTAREMAIEEAKEKAQELAKLAEMKLGRIIDVQESGNQPQPFMMRSAAMEIDLAGDELTPTPIEPGSSEVSVSVTLSYETR